ncbi:MAG: Gfo/Idh/MocA family oxidoreductase [Acidobacteriota bacterium]
MSHDFALVGAAGFIAPRHLRAIRDTGNRLVAATDPHDCVGILDSYALDVKFFPEIERFDRHLEKLRRRAGEAVEYVSICSPNYLHDAHIRLALRVGAHAICEKPLVINPWNLDALERLEEETGRRVSTVLQLRVHPALLDLKKKIEAEPDTTRHEVTLTYVTARGPWYAMSWKGNAERSGGIACNIGIHFFDLLAWLFGPVTRAEVHVNQPQRMAGFLELSRATVRWFLSLATADLPFAAEPGGNMTHRSIAVDGTELEFTQGFTGLHTRVYEDILAGGGSGIAVARPSIELAHRLRHAAVSQGSAPRHPLVQAAPDRSGA